MNESSRISKATTMNGCTNRRSSQLPSTIHVKRFYGRTLLPVVALGLVSCARGFSIYTGSRYHDRMSQNNNFNSRYQNFRTRRSSITLSSNEMHHHLRSSTNVITSSKSTTIKRIQAILSKRKKRLEFGQTIVEGPKMIFDLLQNPKTTRLVQQLLISADCVDQYADRLQPFHDFPNLQIQLIEPSLFKSCTNTVTPQGIISLVSIPDVTPMGTKKIAEESQHPFYLVLDGVSDPGNIGTLIRSSLAVGVSSIILLPSCCDIWNPKAVRSAMGASFQLPILEVASWDEATKVMTDDWNVRQIYAATMLESNDEKDDQNCSKPYYDINWLEEASALVIGSEGNGLSDIVRDSVEGIRPTNINAQIGAVHVPMQAGIESLNAAVCGSVIMFEYARQCNQSRA